MLAAKIAMTGRRIVLMMLLGWTVMTAGLCPAAEASDKTIGVIMAADIPYYQAIHQAFLDQLADAGLGTDKATVHLQTPEPDPMAWANAARKFIAYDVDLIICYGLPATLATLQERSKIPTVFAGVFYTDALNLNKGNATGITSTVPVETLVKNLKSLKAFARLGIVLNGDESDTVLATSRIEALQSKHAFQPVLFDLARIHDLPASTDIDALLFTSSVAAMSRIAPLMGGDATDSIPTAATMGGGEDYGVMLTLKANPGEQGRSAADMAVQVLQGTAPAEIAVKHPTQIDLVINLKAASNMGMAVPFNILSAATKVIK
ncbi:MAG: ABC transporter substrate binding protein [bacterium]|nr:ABC transporter substrate binding protein [bacterium]